MTRVLNCVLFEKVSSEIDSTLVLGFPTHGEHSTVHSEVLTNNHKIRGVLNANCFFGKRPPSS